MLDLWLIRHGETDWNLDGRLQGAVDIPLNSQGRDQARRLAMRLSGRQFDFVYASDLGRAYETAGTVVPGADVVCDARLREIAAGTFEGVRVSDLDGNDLALWSDWKGDPFNQRLPGGESYSDVMARVSDFKADLPADGSVAVFSHGGTIRAFLYTVFGRPTSQFWRPEIGNTSITRLHCSAKEVTVMSINDCAHLEFID